MVIDILTGVGRKRDLTPPPCRLALYVLDLGLRIHVRSPNVDLRQCKIPCAITTPSK